MIFAHWRARRASKALIEQIRGEIVAAARRPALYEALGAPDRVDGRFEPHRGETVHIAHTTQAAQFFRIHESIVHKRG